MAMRNPATKMRSLLILLQMCLLGLAASDNSTVDDVSVFFGAGIHPDSDAVGQNVVWGEWSPWTKWSPCTRSCGGGISRQQRRCRRKPCKGKSWNIKYKVCNIQACEDASDFRAEQCAAFDSVPYSGQLLKWYPHHDPKRPCSLICRGVQATSDQDGTTSFRRTRKVEKASGGLDNDETIGDQKDDGVVEEEDDENLATELDTDDAIVVQLADKVEDGTRCHTDSADVCIAGSCSKVGCDMRVGSNKNKDSCGVCGGNGSSCQPRYSWSLESISACSKSCGSGFKMATPVCKSSDEIVADESNCDADAKPNKTLLPCNTHSCSTKWITGEWSRCSASCGGGSRTRPIFCTEENGNETTKLPDHRCNAIHKPRYQESCNAVSCPAWESSQWSQCSVSCGNGVRTRTSECRDTDGRLSSDCDAAERPRDKQECKTNVPCVTYSGEMTQPLMQPYPAPPAPEKLIDQKVPSESTFIAEEWSSCSVTCGEGFRHREVHCKIFLEFSRTIAMLPDKQCAGPKPVETEKCIMEPCAPLDNSVSYRIDTVGDSGYEESNLMDSYRSSSGTGHSGYEGSVKVAPGSSVQTTYSWKEAGYTPCTATCLGGVQDLIINCVRDDDGKVVMPLLCTKETKPELRIRTCNDHPCPPRWNYSDFSECKSPCGIGIQTRDVMCIHEVARGPEGTISLPNHMCKSPPPVDRQHCNVWDCPVKWQPSDWSRCSKSCGGGVKRRKVVCEQVMAQGHKQYRSDRDCPMGKPLTEKPCNTRPCHEMSPGAQPTIQSVNTTFVQRDLGQKVDLKIGGTATVFPGTGVVKIRCPVKKFKRNQIEWTKNGEQLQKSRKYKISKKGALRIVDITHSDDGIYACIAGQARANIRLIVNGRPREQMSSEEILRSGNTVHHRQNGNLDSAQAKSGENLQIDRAAPGYQDSFTFGNDDLSHEARPEIPASGKPTKKPRKKKPRPSSLPPDSSMAHGEYTVTSLNQPGYQESVESISSSASQLKPHLSQLISSLKAYWPFQGDANSGSGHGIAPPMLLDDSGKNAPRIHRAEDRSENDIKYESRESGFKIFGGETVIPDDTFGPDEERIFIDDDPYDLDAAFFAIHHEAAPKINDDSTRSEDHQSRSHHENHRPPGSQKSLRNAKRQDEEIVDNYLRNQRGTGLTDYKGRKGEVKESREKPRIQHPNVDRFYSKSTSQETITDARTQKEFVDKKIEKVSDHSKDFAGDDIVSTHSTISTNHQSRSHDENHRPSSSSGEQSEDYVEKSLRNTKRQDEEVEDSYLRNQRGTGLSDYEEEKSESKESREETLHQRPTVDSVYLKNASQEKIADAEPRKEFVERIIEKKSTHPEDLAKGNIPPTKSTSDETIRKFVQKLDDRLRDHPTSLADRTTTHLPEEDSKKAGYFRSELLFENIEDDESYDGELSREKSTTRDRNETDSDEVTEERKVVEIRESEGPNAFANETTREDSSGGAEVTKEEDVIDRSAIRPGIFGHDATIGHPRDSSKGRVSNESAGTVALAFENSGSSNETAITGSINVFRHELSGAGEDLIFEWVTTDWSKCSQTCGGGGFQMRGAQCTVRPAKRANSTSRVASRTVIGASLCEDAGFPVPQKVRPCGAGRCPQWYTGEWTACENSRCFNWKTAMQRRDISCRLTEDTESERQNVTILDFNKCDDGIRPPQRQECYNDACKGVWRVGEWSECTASCGDSIKYRILQCVWFGTKKPAGNACRDISRPPVMKMCSGPPCQPSPDECKDHSKLCSKVKLVNMCRVPLYQKQCCETCR